ncbi:uncharacterized protein cubi_00215 [Cryptosporidium ubiquitum]|uniref:Uncharacterized protein n=1 Tax=Cryptosporidium ubiquitum TaxID=857276 RepID=A0A1J4MKD2_9CRYT|nr:uncharacterized protein cubi_00215 [Cryptosporidium ubiquitum]OII74662.1 hypothetical protein cubi_00215 [Cryptosporidium ubiquitum]
MILDDRLSNLERKVNEQNEAIKKIALYSLEILDENDRLWKQIMKDIFIKKYGSLHRKTSEPTLRFRSKTPPPLNEPNFIKEEQSLRVRKRIEEFNKDMVSSILKMEMGQSQIFSKNGRK